MKCAEADAFIHAYVDGELAGVDRDAYEQHLVECDSCSRGCRLQARFKAAIRGHLQRPAVPDRLQRRLTSVIAEAAPIARRWPWQRFPRLVPALTAAMALGTVMFAVRTRRSPVLEQALLMNTSDIPMDVIDSNCASIADWFRGKLGYTVPPARLAKVAPCQGGRLVNVHNGFAAYVVYQTPSGNRLGVLVVPDENEQIDGERRFVQGREMVVGHGRGASTAAVRENGLLYVFTADDESVLPNVVHAVFNSAP